MKSIKFEVPADQGRSNASVIRIGVEQYKEISRIAKMTRLPMTEIANRLLAEALKAVELVETPLYDLNIKED
jgi:hypothetical protein